MATPAGQYAAPTNGAPPPPEGYQYYPPQAPAPGAGFAPPQAPPPGYAQQAPQGYPPAGSQQYPPAAGAPSGYSQYPQAGPSSGYPPPGQSFYSMPSKNAKMNQWQGGGPVGSGVIPPDVEAQVLSAFADQQVRKGFMRKVFTIVVLQLMVTVGFACVCIFVNPVKNYIRAHPWPFYLSWGLSFGLMLVLACNERLRRTHPINMIMLALFTICQAFLVGMISSFFDTEIVLIAFALTLAAVIILAVIAATPCLDVTSWGSAAAIVSMFLLILIIVGIFWVNTIWYLVISGIGAALACFYIVYDLQLIMGGKQYAISPDEYVFAALSLYMDIVQLFIWLLYILGLSGAGR